MGLMSWAPGVNLGGAKAVKMYGGYTMQKMKSDEKIILNMFARTDKEQFWKSICGYILLFCVALLSVANTLQRPQV